MGKKFIVLVVLFVIFSCDPSWQTQKWIIFNNTNSNAIMYYHGLVNYYMGSPRPDTVILVGKILSKGMLSIAGISYRGNRPNKGSAPPTIYEYDSVVFEFTNNKKLVFKQQGLANRESIYWDDRWMLERIGSDYRYTFTIEEADLN